MAIKGYPYLAVFDRSDDNHPVFIAPQSAAIGLAGPYSFDPTTYDTTKEIFSPAIGTQDARPVTFVSAGSPPALLMYGLADETVRLENSRDLVAALQGAGVPVRSVEFKGIGHSGLLLAISRPLRWRAPVLAETVAFIRARAGS